MISISGITKVYYGSSKEEPIVALDNVSFEIKKNEFVSIVGRSGAGKTTLLKLIIAEEEPTKGTIFLDKCDIFKLSRKNLPLLRRRFGVIFQDYKLFSSKTAYENVAYVMEVMGATDAQIARDVPQVLELVGLLDRADNFPHELSGGEKQRLAIARALIHRPDIILADEPTGNLDPYNTFEIIRLLKKLHELGNTVILSTHDKEVINRLGERVITLENGRVIRDEKRGKFIL